MSFKILVLQYIILAVLCYFFSIVIEAKKLKTKTLFSVGDSYFVSVSEIVVALVDYCLVGR